MRDAISVIEREIAAGFESCCDSNPFTWEQLRAFVAAANAVVDAQKRLIHAVTPGHPGWINSRGPNSTPEDEERYDALFGEWHAASRRLRDALGRKSEYA